MTCCPAALGGSLELCGIRSCSHEPEVAGAVSFGPALLPPATVIVTQFVSEPQHLTTPLVHDVDPPGPPSPPPRS